MFAILLTVALVGSSQDQARADEARERESERGRVSVWQQATDQRAGERRVGGEEGKETREQ